MNLLTNRKFVIATNNWYSPLADISRKYNSIIAGELMDTMSSAGDWSGFFIQKTGKDTVVAIGFSQYNNYPNKGFTLLTCEYPFYRGKIDEENLFDNVRSCWLQFDND